MIQVHFLNVGHGDCTVIRHASGHLTVIDINNGDELDPTSASELLYPRLFEGYAVPLTNPVQFLKTQYANQEIFRYVQSHPDLDHMRGLAAVAREGIYVRNFWDTEHDKVPDFQSDSDEDEWGQYEHFRSGKAGASVLRLHQGAQGDYYTADGIEVLWPHRDYVRQANDAEEWNDLSYVLRLSYGGVKVILGADAGESVWDILAQQYGSSLKCDVLKASHHGRDSGYFADAVKLMSPQYTIVSVGSKPETDASNKYRQYSQEVWSTRWKGDITLTIQPHGSGQITGSYNHS